MEPRRSLMMVTLTAAALLLAGRAGIAAFDICGCVNSPKSLGVFDTVARTGFPPGTVDNFRDIRIPVPADGTIILNSANFLVRPEEGCCLTVTFVGNQANTPVTILVSGDVNIASSVTLAVNAVSGGGGSPGGAGTGGLGGPGGFRGGDAAYQLTNGASDGGSGLGPSGGAPGLATGATRAGDGTFFGLAALLPLAGGSGGGGGASFGAQFNCAGGGGGGGGGAILIAANGTITMNGAITADGGNVGFESNGACATRGGAGAGGAVRLVANAIVGTGGLFARGGFVDCCTRTGGPGVVTVGSRHEYAAAAEYRSACVESCRSGPARESVFADRRDYHGSWSANAGAGHRQPRRR